MFGLGMQELVIIGIVAVLLFGKRLPEVAKSMGTSYREFRRGLSDLQSQVDLSEAIDSAGPSSTSSNSSSSDSPYDEYDDYDNYDEATAPRFEPPPTEPQDSVDIDSPAGEFATQASEDESENISEDASEDPPENVSEKTPEDPPENISET